jgi:radical SAM superfamily enzyme YgiQ (UPF0313 family)
LAPIGEFDRTCITLINPNELVLIDDLFTTGIPYAPVGLAYFAAALKSNGYTVQVIDAFGDNPKQSWKSGEFLFIGLKPEEVANRLGPTCKIAVVYAINITYHRSIIYIAQAIKRLRPDVSIVAMENTQAVTAYSLRHVQEEFYNNGIDYILTGESEKRGVRLIECILENQEPEGVDGIGYRKSGATKYTPPIEKIDHLDVLPFPAWDLFPIENYWKLKYAHGPLKTDKYLPLLTSRGCPYPCKFCVIPETNDTKWRARSAKNVVDEMEEYSHKFGVREFHLEDVNPTVNDKRTREICEEILRRNLSVIWKISSGTKVETIRNADTIELMAKAGCRYVSISPESGSPRVLKMVNKPFHLEHAIQLVQKMNEVGIYSQACFVLGFPGETDEDRQMTQNMVRDLTRVGVDEIALFIVTPVPGSDIFSQFSGYTDYSQLNFSPTWRSDYSKLNHFRLKLYRNFLMWKLKYHPLKLAKQPFNFLRARFDTKMEMAPYRALKTFFLVRNAAHVLS